MCSQGEYPVTMNQFAVSVYDDAMARKRPVKRRDDSMVGQPKLSSDSYHHHCPREEYQFPARLCQCCNASAIHHMQTYHVVLEERVGLATWRGEATE